MSENSLNLHPSVGKILELKRREFSHLKDVEVSPASEKFKLRSALTSPGRKLKVIAEFKRASPSLGWINKDANVDFYVRLYDKYADALSILTERHFFKGGFKFVKRASELTSKPILAKDFFVDPKQVKYALMSGASAVLLVMRVVDDSTAKGIYSLATYLGLDVIVEVHSVYELERAERLFSPVIIGINTRNFSDLSIHPGVVDEIAPIVKGSKIVIAESGIEKPADVEKLVGKVNAVLIGSAIMKSSEPQKFFEEMLKWAGE